MFMNTCRVKYSVLTAFLKSVHKIEKNGIGVKRDVPKKRLIFIFIIISLTILSYLLLFSVVRLTSVSLRAKEQNLSAYFELQNKPLTLIALSQACTVSHLQFIFQNMQVLEEEKTKLDAFCEQSLKNVS